MKFKYVVLLEILRIMVTVMQIFDAKISIKTSLEVQKSRKTLTKNDYGSQKGWYVEKARNEGITKLVLNRKMDKITVCFCSIKGHEVGEFEWQWRGVSCVCICVYKAEN